MIRFVISHERQMTQAFLWAFLYYFVVASYPVTYRWFRPGQLDLIAVLIALVLFLTVLRLRYMARHMNSANTRVMTWVWCFLFHSIPTVVFGAGWMFQPTRLSQAIAERENQLSKVLMNFDLSNFDTWMLALMKYMEGFAFPIWFPLASWCAGVLVWHHSRRPRTQQRSA